MQVQWWPYRKGEVVHCFFPSWYKRKKRLRNNRKFFPLHSHKQIHCCKQVRSKDTLLISWRWDEIFFKGCLEPQPSIVCGSRESLFECCKPQLPPLKLRRSTAEMPLSLLVCVLCLPEVLPWLGGLISHLNKCSLFPYYLVALYVFAPWKRQRLSWGRGCPPVPHLLLCWRSPSESGAVRPAGCHQAPLFLVSDCVLFKYRYFLFVSNTYTERWMSSSILI